MKIEGKMYKIMSNVAHKGYKLCWMSGKSKENHKSSLHILQRIISYLHDLGYSAFNGEGIEQCTNPYTFSARE